MWQRVERQGDGMRFTEEELQTAKSVDLTLVAERLGYTVMRIGRYHTLKEMDSIRIYNHTHWFRWSRKEEKGKNGGSQIDFLREFAGLEIKEAVFWLLDFTGYRRLDEVRYPLRNQVPVKVPEEKKPFILPKAAGENYYLYQYLTKQRAISHDVVRYFVKKGLIYEAEQYHNIIFKGNSRDGTTHFASMRGVRDDAGGKGFKCDVAGNDKSYGFNDAHEDSGEIIVFESAIDLMSYVDIFHDFESSKLALGMVGDAPLETFLREYPRVRQIAFCLDNDVAGMTASRRLQEKYEGRGYRVALSPPPEGYKDYNEWLKTTKAGLQNEKNEMNRKVI